MNDPKGRLTAFLRWSERYTKTDMVYLAQSNFWLQATSLSVSFGSFLLYIVFGHVLSKEVYGTYQYLLSLGALVGAFTLTGMNGAVVRAVARGFEGTYLKAMRAQLVWNLVPMLGAWMCGAYYLLHGNATLGWGLVLIGVFVPLTTTFNTYGAYLTAKRDFARNFWYSLFSNVPYYLSVALIAISLPAALALLAANLISQGLGYFVAHRRVLTVYRPNTEVEPGAMEYGRHLSVVNFLNTAMAQIDNILVFHFLGAANLAIYSFATAIPDRLNVFRNIAAAAFPKFASRTADEVRSSLGRKVALSVIVAFFIAGAYAIIAPLFFEVFFPRYIDAVPFSQAYAFIIAVAVWPIFTTALTAQGRLKSLYAYNIVSPALQLVLQIAAIIWWGLWGLIVARVIGALLSSLIGWALFSVRSPQQVSG